MLLHKPKNIESLALWLSTVLHLNWNMNQGELTWSKYLKSFFLILALAILSFAAKPRPKPTPTPKPFRCAVDDDEPIKIFEISNIPGFGTDLQGHAGRGLKGHGFSLAGRNKQRSWTA